MQKVEKEKKEADFEKACEEFNAAFDKEISLNDFPILEPYFMVDDYDRIDTCNNTKVKQS